jgi:hypothetical protein
LNDNLHDFSKSIITRNDVNRKFQTQDILELKSTTEVTVFHNVLQSLNSDGELNDNIYFIVHCLIVIKPIGYLFFFSSIG